MKTNFNFEDNGGLGRLARERLGGLAEVVRLSDVAEMAPAGPGEEVMRCDLEPV